MGYRGGGIYTGLQLLGVMLGVHSVHLVCYGCISITRNLVDFINFAGFTTGEFERKGSTFC